MGKLVVSLDGVVIKEVQITKDKTTLGRRPYNDIVIDNLAVSGEHAVLQMVGADVFIEDLNSTNGTYINGKAVKKQLLSHNDTVEIGKYKIKYLVEDGTDYEKTMIMKPGAVPGGGGPQSYSPTVGFGASGFGSLVSMTSLPAARSCSPRWSPPSANPVCRSPPSPSARAATCSPTSRARCAPPSTAARSRARPCS